MSDDRLLLRLKYGSWNRWRQEHPGVAVNLDGPAHDGTVSTSVDFSRVSLRNASLHATNLMNADLHGADLTGANLVQADLIDANLEGAILRGASLREADVLGARLTGVQFAPEDLNGALPVPRSAGA